MKEETKREARERNIRELKQKGIIIGPRKAKTARLSQPIEKRLQGKCMVCGRAAWRCICAGHMTEEAQKRFHENNH